MRRVILTREPIVEAGMSIFELREAKRIIREDIDNLKEERDSLLAEVKEITDSLDVMESKESLRADQNKQAAVFEAVELCFGITESQVKVKTRKQEILYARNYFMQKVYSMHKGKMSLAKVGAIVGKDHATVIHAQKTHETQYRRNKGYRKSVNAADLLIGEYLRNGGGLV